jgi:diguanylate cyclase (GGDEF)-like protein
MVSRDECLGLLAIASYTANAFDEDDETLLSNVASQAALAIDNARQHAEVKEQARRDSLTGVYNHGYFLARLNEAIELGRQNQSPVALIMLDIDKFKAYNDTYGHFVGDEVLRQLAQTIQKHIQKTDFVGRWGGEEFAIALPGSTADDACQVAQKLRAALVALELFARTGERISSPTVSQGIACFPEQALSASELVDVADQALYQAKGGGRDQVRSASASQSAHRV